MFLSANAPTTEQNPDREVVDLGSNLVWELGESVTFSCGASPATFSQGIRWALQDDEGVLHFQPQGKTHFLKILNTYLHNLVTVVHLNCQSRMIRNGNILPLPNCCQLSPFM